MDADLAQKAISAALDANWKEAISLNQQILKDAPTDIDALNRLSRALAETGDLKKAKRVAEKVLKLDPSNSIATKALARWKGLRKVETASSSLRQADAFLEEPGKTKMLCLLHLGDVRLISKLNAGDEVKLSPHSHRVCVLTQDGRYIGRLPDDLAARLRKFISLGNEYKILVKSIEPDDVKIFIREVKRGEKVSNTPSFPIEKIDYISFTPPELVHKREVSFSAQEEES